MIFSCDDKQREEAIQLQKMVDQRIAEHAIYRDFLPLSGYNNTGQSNYGSSTSEEYAIQQKRRAREAKNARIEKCKRRLNRQIELIDERFEQGYTATQGERMRAKRKRLLRRIDTDCR